ncbi:DUF748 domain-containing protein [Massilia sp. B-10]|nr:DUF748 domain-containing protein [Massilia sp. B-10]
MLIGGFKGDASVDRLATVDKASSSDFVSWKSLALDGMDVTLGTIRPAHQQSGAVRLFRA